jgi:hypothetical protein
MKFINIATGEIVDVDKVPGGVIVTSHSKGAVGEVTRGKGEKKKTIEVLGNVKKETRSTISEVLGTYIPVDGAACLGDIQSAVAEEPPVKPKKGKK